jgi:hypothetical protein
MRYEERRAVLLEALQEIQHREKNGKVGAEQARRAVDASLLVFINDSESTDDDLPALMNDAEVTRVIDTIGRWDA